jgi:hypothetical protein
MADRVSASIAIGGRVNPLLLAQLAVHIANYDLRMDWDGEPFDPAYLPIGDTLRLFAHEVPWGIFDGLEQYCCEVRLAYQRWSGSCPGSFGAERIVYDGKTGPLNFSVDEDDHLVLHAQTILQLGSMRAIRRYIAQAEFTVPHFMLADDG